MTIGSAIAICGICCFAAFAFWCDAFFGCLFAIFACAVISEIVEPKPPYDFGDEK